MVKIAANLFIQLFQSEKLNPVNEQENVHNGDGWHNYLMCSWMVLN